MKLPKITHMAVGRAEPDPVPWVRCPRCVDLEAERDGAK